MGYSGVLIAAGAQRTESYVLEEMQIGASVYRRSERKSSACRQYAEIRFESGMSSGPPNDSEIVPCEEPMGRIPRLRGDREKGIDA